MTPASIRYLLVLDDLCREGKGVRSVEIAARMNVSKPSAHSMLQNLCQAGLVEKERYGTVWGAGGGGGAARRPGACAILAQSQDRLPQLRDRLTAE